VLVAGEQAALAQGFLLLECVLNVRCLCPGCAAEGEPADGVEEGDALRC
jgi:hypothetical protein